MASDDEAGGRGSNNYEELLDEIPRYQNRAEILQRGINVLRTNLDKCIKSFILNTMEMAKEVTNYYQNLTKFQGEPNTKTRKVKRHFNDPNLSNELPCVSNNTTLIKSNDSTPLLSLKEKVIHRKRTSQTFDYSNIQSLEEFNVFESILSKKAVVVLEDVLISEGRTKNKIKTNEEIRNKKNSKSNMESKSLRHVNKKMENSNLLDTPRSSRELRLGKAEQSRSNADDICRKSARIAAHPPRYFQTKPTAILRFECLSNEIERLLTKQNSCFGSTVNQLVDRSKKDILPNKVTNVISSNMEGMENPTTSTNKNKKGEPDRNQKTGRGRIGG